jgi:hypothetical protein
MGKAVKPCKWSPNFPVKTPRDHHARDSDHPLCRALVYGGSESGGGWGDLGRPDGIKNGRKWWVGKSVMGPWGNTAFFESDFGVAGELYPLKSTIQQRNCPGSHVWLPIRYVVEKPYISEGLYYYQFEPENSQCLAETNIPTL